MPSLIDCLELLQSKSRATLPKKLVRQLKKEHRAAVEDLSTSGDLNTKTQRAAEHAILDRHQQELKAQLAEIKKPAEPPPAAPEPLPAPVEPARPAPNPNPVGIAESIAEIQRRNAPGPVEPPAVVPAAVEAGQRIEQFLPSENALGLTATKSGRIDETIVTRNPGDTLKSGDAKVEARWSKASGRVRESIAARAKAAAAKIKDTWHEKFSTTRADRFLEPGTDGVWIDSFRRLRTIPQHSEITAAKIIQGLTAGFGRNKFEIYQRNIILRDLARDVEAGHYAGKDTIRFGYTEKTLAADVAKFNDLAQLNPQVAEALVAREKFFNALRADLIDAKLLPEDVKGDYFHRQVHDLAIQKSFTGSKVRADAKVHTENYQRARTHGDKDYNTNYLESEFEVISQALGQLRTKKAINEEFKPADIKAQVKAQAAIDGVDWRKNLPEGYTTWQAKDGNAFYHALSIPDKVLNNIIKGISELKREDLKEVMVMAGPKEEWVIPTRLAQTLDTLKPTESTAIGQLIVGTTNSWKQWTLINPLRSARYFLNNATGDIDATLAYSPKIALKYGRGATKDVWQFTMKKGSMTREISDGIDYGVLNSGFSVAEVAKLNSHQFFRSLTGERTNPVTWAWELNKDVHAFREDVLRLASWRYFKDQLADGKRYYGASRKSEVDALYNEGKPTDQIAAKLARELVGDYGNISYFGQWMRSHVIPFYSWMEVNMPRYYRILKNSASEGTRQAALELNEKPLVKGRGGVLSPQQPQSGASAFAGTAARVAGIAAKKAAFIPLKMVLSPAKTAVLAGGMYGAITLWNKALFPDEERELGDQRRQLHMILGRREDGTVRTLRMQGALSDALAFFGLETPSDIEDVASGRISKIDMAKKMLLAAPSKLISGVTPWIKTPAEVLTKRSLFPTPTNPGPFVIAAKKLHSCSLWKSRIGI